ncbi:peptidoglycan editing factor PgeF [Polynucleobacter sp. 15G-AUS-farblos]|uniref:peptidoglycan editing factor PgeF n=1 Tax=Polynucleobacter sp. 15G-AUS-farblos TaxID=2689094 RepID=UPI001C0B3CC0|nr:peptidoglycan editing factor PgeF [Polynucleobacter sp. 15G-AUS-farblos]MBU3582395.1 peptidoglycan editing factor PgeF [Polynucleobacter sp. 15G-AUS-farblos]
MKFIKPIWPAPYQVHSLVSTRLGGVSKIPYDSLNLGDHVGDSLELVAHNRDLLRRHLPSDPIWLNQVHSTLVSTPDQRINMTGQPIVADAIISVTPNEVLTIMTADCLPVLFTANDGSIIGAAHAGWKGLCAGILENTVSEMLASRSHLKSSDLLAYMGPAIGPKAYEVGEDVYSAFQSSSISIKKGDFQAIPNKKGKYLADLYSIATNRLLAIGLKQVAGGQMCTFSDSEHFYSYRRNGVTGRFASMIWIAK